LRWSCLESKEATPSLQTEPLAQRRDGACGQAIHCAGGGLGLAARAEWPVVDATITMADAIGVVNKGFHMVVCRLFVIFALCLLRCFSP